MGIEVWLNVLAAELRTESIPTVNWHRLSAYKTAFFGEPT
jgi:hypothetical protein